MSSGRLGENMPSGFPQAVDSLMAKVRPQFEAGATRLRERYPQYRFQVDDYTNPVSRTLSVGCDFPGPFESADAPDDVALCLTFFWNTDACRGMADITWGHPSGHVEDSLPYDWQHSDEWPVLTEEFADEILSAIPRLLESFERAVARGCPE
ncbi:MAG: hypothetical protein P4L99_03255 [Chthoniobacter sp.]|nr:hypothetical protein [Chthoniobacter sp.]